MRLREQVVDDMPVLAAQAGQVEAFGRLGARWHPRLLVAPLATGLHGRP